MSRTSGQVERLLQERVGIRAVVMPVQNQEHHGVHFREGEDEPPPDGRRIVGFPCSLTKKLCQLVVTVLNEVL